MVQGTPACCLPLANKRQRSKKFRGAALVGHCLLSCALAEKSPRRIFALCRVAVARSPLLVRMQQIGRMAEHPLARPMREWLPEIDFGVMHHGFAPHGHNHALILQAAGVRDHLTHAVELQYETRIR